MVDFKNLIKKNYSELILFSIIFLFFIQMLSDLAERIFDYAILGLKPTLDILALVFLLSSIGLLFFRKSISNKTLFIVGELFIVTRLIEPLLKGKGLLILAGLSVSSFLIFFPAYFTSSKNKEQQTGITLGISLAIAVAVSVLFRTVNSTLDLSIYRWYQIIGWLLGIVASLMLVGMLLKGETDVQKESSEEKSPASFGKILLLTLGLSSVFVIIWFTFMSPTSISRWTEGNYIGIVIGVSVMTVLFIVGMLVKPDLMNMLKSWMLWAWNGVFALTLTLTVLVHQKIPSYGIFFPDEVAAYPIIAAPTTWVYHIPLVLMIILSPIIYIDFILLSRELLKIKPKPAKIGGSFALGVGLYGVIMIFMQVLPNVWGYLPPISNVFRDMYWLAFLVPGIFITVPIFLLKKSTLSFEKTAREFKSKSIILTILGLIFIGTVAGAFVSAPHPVAQDEGKTSLIVMTYNIRLGVNLTGEKNYDGQVELIKSVDPDILCLQESDTARIGGGNSDVVRYFADKLDMYSYRGAKTVTNTYGTAILSKYPITNVAAFFMYSTHQQISTTQAQIEFNSTLTFNVFSNHPAARGDDAKRYQIEEILSQTTGLDNVLLGGDFNFRPYSESYNITIGVLEDSWVQKWSTPAESRIDHIFLSSGLTVLNAEYIERGQSDHPAYWIEIQL
ncbi:MAG: endonuclease/exonuclease/phosphatase family protein [Candidatus Heimdallarchaeota archaeon]|nr:endonuclease/exonuclease/phosphatase family protein [Candidatus Heimdallarchaeota archaeon]MCK4770524.1 endonuclease/exonuclease/phosphatase family protein [Candidatus Heimdallarchaeota archaeon]